MRILIAVAFFLGGGVWAQNESAFWGKWVVKDAKVSPESEVGAALLSPERISAYLENFKQSTSFEFFNDGRASVVAFGSGGEGRWRYDASDRKIVFYVGDRSESVPVRFLDSGLIELTREVPGMGKFLMILTKS
jgi:hypothetical protein